MPRWPSSFWPALPWRPTLTPQVAVVGVAGAVAGEEVVAEAALTPEVAVGAMRAAAGGGGGRQNAQVNNSKADARTNNVRNTSVNNVNVDSNVNVNVDGGCCNNGWDNDYHPVATAAAAVGTAVAVTSAVVGSMVNTVPAWLRAGELWRHGLPAMRRHLVRATGTAVHRRSSALLIVGRSGPRSAARFLANAVGCKRGNCRYGAALESYSFLPLSLKTSLNRRRGRTRLATTVAIQMIRVAMTQVPTLVMLRPLVRSVVTSNPTNVVTRAIPPIRYGALCRANFDISGSRITVDTVKMQTATANPRPLMENPGNSIAATTRAIAFARSNRAA